MVTASESIETMGELQRQLLSQGNSWWRQAGDEAARTAAMNGFLWNRTLAGLLPVLSSLAEVRDQIVDSWLKVMTGRRSLADHLNEIGDRTSAGMRYGRMVTTLGKQLLGSARFEGEEVIFGNELFTLSYLPPRTPDGLHPPLFHVGGFLPLGDRIFRILPETNLFRPFLERGIPVYALEKRGVGLPSEQLTLERLVEIIDEASDVAFQHNGGRRMILEGYCALAMQALSYVCALPEQAERKFKVALSMVGPIDGRRCTALADMMDRTPDYAILLGQMMAAWTSGYVDGNALRSNIDIPFGTYVWKTPLGRFLTGWQRRELAGVESVEKLGFAERRELAGAYWISPENSRQVPIPVDLVRFSARLWREGIGPDGSIPYRFRDQPLSLATLRDRTSIQVVGMYGSKDTVIPPQTAHILIDLLQDRYRHVVHGVGHVSYILSPEIWDPSHDRALTPNPIDVLLEAYAKGQRVGGERTRPGKPRRVEDLPV